MGTCLPSHIPQSDLNHNRPTLPRARHPSLLDQFLKLPPLPLGEATCPHTTKLADITLHIFVQEIHGLVGAWPRHLPDPLV